MKKTESGRAMCVAVFKQLIELIILFGQRYAPSRQELQMSGLTALLAAAATAIETVNEAASALTSAIKARLIGFAELPSLVTKCRYIAESSGIPPDKIEGLKSLIRKIKGQRASKKLSPEELEKLAAEGNDVHQRSSSQTAFANRVNNFSLFIDILAKYPEYNPTEQQFSVAGLREYCDKLVELNSNVMTSYAKLSAARTERDKLLFDKNGVCRVGLDAKSYIKAIFGIKSREYTSVAHLHFRRPAA